MSYDIEFIGGEPSDLNITSNLREMFSWAFGVDYWCDVVEGETGENVSNKLIHAIVKMLKYPDKAKKFDSPNGWGTYNNALKFLIDFHAECLKNKESRVHIDK